MQKTTIIIQILKEKIKKGIIKHEKTLLMDCKHSLIIVSVSMLIIMKKRKAYTYYKMTNITQQDTMTHLTTVKISQIRYVGQLHSYTESA